MQGRVNEEVGVPEHFVDLQIRHVRHVGEEMAVRSKPRAASDDMADQRECDIRPRQPPDGL